MRFFNFRWKIEPGTILYRVLGVFLAICWTIIGGIAVLYFFERAYLYPLKYRETVYEYADYYGLERALIFAVIRTESGFNEKAESRAGAIGLMQIQERTGEYIAGKLGVENYDLSDVETNVNFGCYYLKYLYIRFGVMDTAIVAYNAGEGRVSLWLSQIEYSKDGKNLIEVPYKESKEYRERINKSFEKYKKLYGNILDKQKKFE